MQKSRILIAKNTLRLLEKKSFNNIKLDEVFAGSKNKSIKTKYDLLININMYIDFLLNNNLKNIEKSSFRDMLFEVFMARLDILNQYRFPIKKLIKYFFYKPHYFIKLIPSFIESIISMAIVCNIKIDGIKGVSKVKVIFILYLIAIYSWYNDETESLEKTMTTLDKYLGYIDKYFKIF